MELDVAWAPPLDAGETELLDRLENELNTQLMAVRRTTGPTPIGMTGNSAAAARHGADVFDDVSDGSDDAASDDDDALEDDLDDLDFM